MHLAELWVPWQPLPTALHADLTWDSGTESVSLLVNAVKLLNEKYLIFPFLQHQRQCSEQQWGGGVALLMGPEPELAVLGLDQAMKQPGWAGAVLTHVDNLLLEQADDPLAASYHLDVEVDHSSAMTAGWDGGSQAGS